MWLRCSGKVMAWETRVVGFWFLGKILYRMGRETALVLVMVMAAARVPPPVSI